VVEPDSGRDSLEPKQTPSTNLTYVAAAGGFSPVNEFSIDQRGYKTLIQSEAATFLTQDEGRVRLNSTVETIAHSPNHGVQVTLTDGQTLRADYAICTFRYVTENRGMN